MKKSKNHDLRKQLDTIVYPQTNHTIVYQGCSWTTTLKNCLRDIFKLGFNKALYIYIVWEIEHFWEFQMKETKKIIINKKPDVLPQSLHVCTAASKAQQCPEQHQLPSAPVNCVPEIVNKI